MCVRMRTMCVCMRTMCVTALLCCLCALLCADAQSPERPERLQVTFKPAVCRLRCTRGRCVNVCELANLTTVSSGAEEGAPFRVFVCPLLCQNGGLCLQKDRCVCPSNFTGKFCQLNAMANHSAASPPFSANQQLTHSQFLLPLGDSPETHTAGAPGRPMVHVRVQHPPEASVEVHKVIKVPASQRAGVTAGSAGFPAPGSRGVQAQSVSGTGPFNHNSGFKYCFREVTAGQCSSPLPGLRSRDTCCRGGGRGWGIEDCTICTDKDSSSNCPTGYERVDGKCEDINECVERDLCVNGLCVNTRGSYSCVCPEGFILDASHGLCISHRVISEEKGQCFRVVSSGSCSLPILRSITKQICCCSRVGKAWGPDCLRCPPFGSAAFKETCPAGPGYHYSASALQFTQRAIEQLGHRGAPLIPFNITHTGLSPNPDPVQTRPSPDAVQTKPSPDAVQTKPSPDAVQTKPSPDAIQTRPSPDAVQTKPSPDAVQTKPSPDAVQTRPSPDAVQTKPSPDAIQTRPSPPLIHTSPNRQNAPASPQIRPVPAQPEARRPSSHGSSPSSTSGSTSWQGQQNPKQSQPLLGVSHTASRPELTRPRPDSPVTTTTAKPRPRVTTTTTKPRLRIPVTTMTTRPPAVRDQCSSSPCGAHSHCQASSESFTCICEQGYRLRGRDCIDVDECADPSQCPGQMCLNSVGSYRCVSCRHGYRLLNRQCIDVDECRQAPCTNGRCENTPGSYRCVCHHGYRLLNNTCEDVDECADPSQCPGQMCLNSVGSYRCVSCRHGYRLLNRQCIDVDECEEKGACPGQMCINSEGSYSCVSCRHGYSSVGGVCTDVDECADPSQCPGQTCLNSVGSYRCVSCRHGYSPRDGSCHDIDECQQSASLCSGGDCVNSPGSYSCICHQGFNLSPNKTSCRDVDECLSAASCGEHASCENLIGGFHCRCDEGYRPDQQGACVAPSSGFSTSSSGSSPSTSGSSHSSSGSSQSTSGSSQSTSGSSHSSSGSSQSTSGSLPSSSGSSPSSSGSSHSPSGSSHSSSSASPSSSGSSHSTPGSSSSSSGSSHPTSGASQSSSGSSLSPSGSSHPSSGASQSSSSSSPSSSDSFTSSFGSSTSIAGSSTSIAGSSLSPSVSPLSPSLPGELRECYYDLDSGECSVLSQNCSLQECCCTEGRGWGQGCVYNTCPRPQTEEFQRLCPNGRGYVTTGPGAFDYTDVDECKLFGSDVCKSGVCVNNIPGFSCYCPSGYVFNLSRLQCEDHNECEEESCSGGLCVNTQGSFYCSCPHPLVLDDTHRTCVNASQHGLDDNVSLCWQQVNADLLCQSLLLGSQLSFTDCCCLYGEGWGLECALCPLQDTEDYARLCSSVHSPLYPETRPGTRPGSGPARGSPQEPYFPPFALEPFPPALDYDDSSPVGGRGDSYDRGYGPPYGGFFPEQNYDPNIPYSPDQSRFSLDQSRFNPDQSRFSPDQSRYTPDQSRFSPDGSRFSPDQSRFSPDSVPFLVPPDPRSEEAFEVPSSLSSDQFYTGTRDQAYTGTRDQAYTGTRDQAYSGTRDQAYTGTRDQAYTGTRDQAYTGTRDQVYTGTRDQVYTGTRDQVYTGTRDQAYTGTRDQDEWRGLPPFNRPEPRRVYDRRSEAVEEDCGIADGCLNGRCIRVAEGYTCDCYHGYELDLTHMTCRDVDECDGSVRPEFPCINARCVNTYGSYRCVCRRGYVLSHRPNYCVSA